MSYAEILKAFGRADAALLNDALDTLETRPVALSKEGALECLLADVTSMGIDDVAAKWSAASKAAAMRQAVPGNSVESSMKRDIVSFLERADEPQLRQLASEAGIRVDARLDADVIRVKIFEETLLLGTEVVLALQTKPTLQRFADALLGSAAAHHLHSKSKAQIIEALMVNIFSLKPPSPAVAAAVVAAHEDGHSSSSGRRPRAAAAAAAPPHAQKRARKGRDDDADGDAGEQDDNDDHHHDEEDGSDGSDGSDSSGDDDEGDDDSPMTKSEVSRLKVAELRDYCTRHKLPTDGLRVALVDRVIAHEQARRK